MNVGMALATLMRYPLADVFDALTTKRPYKEAWTLEKTVHKIQEESGKHFDPKLVEIFTANIEKFTCVMKEFSDV